MTIREPGQSGESVTFLGEFSKKLATNTFFNVLGRFWSFFVTILLTAFHRNYVETPVWATLREVYARPLIAGIIANLAVSGFHRVFPRLVLLEQVHYDVMGHSIARLFILSKILLDLAVFAPVYIVLLIALRQVTEMDRKNFVGLMVFGSEFLRHPFRERVKIYR